MAFYKAMPVPKERIGGMCRFFVWLGVVWAAAGRAWELHHSVMVVLR